MNIYSKCVVFTVVVMTTTILPRLASTDDVPTKEQNSGHIIKQPDYKSWAKIQIGMAESEVKKILGKPIEEDKVPKQFLNDPKYIKFAEYGQLKFSSPALPSKYELSIGFVSGKVAEKHDPFGGAKLSEDGKPTIPIVFSPKNGVIHNHFPRFVDCRWYPSSGQYPIEYVVEVAVSHYEQIPLTGKYKIVYRKWDVISTDVPYCAFTYAGKGQGRCRVKAKNKLGESEWSKWQNFEFLQ